MFLDIKIEKGDVYNFSLIGILEWNKSNNIIDLDKDIIIPLSNILNKKYNYSTGIGYSSEFEIEFKEIESIIAGGIEIKFSVTTKHLSDIPQIEGFLSEEIYDFIHSIKK